MRGRWLRGRSLLLLLRRAFLLAAVSAAALFLLHHQAPTPFKPPSPSLPLAISEELSVEPPPLSAFSEEPSFDPPPVSAFDVEAPRETVGSGKPAAGEAGRATCATVERMGEVAAGGASTEAASLRVRELIRRHFLLHGAARVRSLPALEFCRQGFVLGKASEAGFGNEMYKILTAAALSVMLNRSLIIGQTRGLYPFGQYISYTDHSFTIGEIKHLWRKNRCAQTYGRDLNVRVDNFENPSETNVLCSDWNSWKDPIIWPIRAKTAAVSCIHRAIQISRLKRTPRVALISDTPSFVKEIKQDISDFAEVTYFDYKLFARRIDVEMNGNDKPLGFRSKDWGSAPRWAAFVDFFLASSARYAVVTGAHRRVGTTYVQLVAALAAANRHGHEPSGANFTFLSSIHSNLLVDGLSTQVGWGHVWNRYAGPLSCPHQLHQCALTPLLPHAWWDGQWQSPIPRDVRRLLDYGVQLSNTGEVDDERLVSHCRSRKDHVKRYHVLPPYKSPTRQ
ncbi:uncharacterized protein [Lolium perenne]|uniref:uncharacterized protein isoform X2 n=1 Tax=Lolium perenne TaxID=4522 RepID=UPI0021F5F446|nr:uncharacterized protein LOC127299271 isoform X2 [Lolium perenne]